MVVAVIKLHLSLLHQRTRVAVIACLLLVLMLACTRQTGREQPRVIPSAKTEIKIAAVGDIMMPMSIQKAVAKNKYHYDLLFEKIAEDLHSDDIVFANLETQVDQMAPLSGYPRFNSRPELLSAIKKAGFNIVSVANNHALDMKPEGLIRTLDNIEATGLRFTGAGRSRNAAEQAVLVTANSVTVAFLGYTYGTNRGIPRSAKSQPFVNILRNGSDADLTAVLASVRKVRSSTDLVVVSLHWGDEYRTEPTVWQRRVAVKLINAGADVILGHHPHVLQPIEFISTSEGRQGLIAYSLGNFVTSQNYGLSDDRRPCPQQLLGDSIILTLYATKEHGRMTITHAEFHPIWTKRDKVGASVIIRPVTIDREIQRLIAREVRVPEDDGTIAMLKNRRQTIKDQLGTRLMLLNPWR
jgi:poly-gamma-glutamate capsule biosynthesis protein CapA/YwtB (metallophosphatase superfamily)